MAATTQQTDEALIVRYVDPDPRGRGPAEARLAEYGIAIWALVAYLRACNWDVDEVARDYEIPREAVEAAAAYYRRHQSLIDARLLLNESA
jgi:uncharacterized protein (DUF433 family)